ncbi:hypothetical protein LMG28614_04946 [Paraburkholderia ultramafica]|uniref:Phytase-like domain-containing protein n=1 Tax=Paraburkholderia ultramafica TaxID=1544867 RepID=A0A6S7BH28_9BURK|nr:hypothetical protein [Paraburkholderia ultramafica]CAB3799349.1 hypothetical protein LMG28614_04946 [Paraburkholderia ultramafica]
MLRLCPRRFVWVLVLALWAVAVHAKEFVYHYVSLDAAVPSSFLFFDPIVINDSGRVYGNLYSCGNTNCDYLAITNAVYAAGTLTTLQPGITYAVNNEGTVGGSVLIDPINFIEQAALFHGDSVELIPRQPGESTSHVIALNDPGTALVASSNASGQLHFVLYSHGRATPLDFGPTVTNPDPRGMNNQGIIAGIENKPLNAPRGFRFDPRTREATLLTPLPTEPDAWGLGINDRGDVLGYSFVGGGRERVGVWDRDAQFNTYFVEGTPEFPTISNRLVFNGHNQIVISFVLAPDSEKLKYSYLVPKPGVRLNVADLVENLPSGANLSFIADINNHGDMIGSGNTGAFLLARVDASTAAAPASSLSSGNERHAIPPAAAAMLRRYMSRLHPLKPGAALP